MNAGEVVYRLPAPPGYWLSSGKCEVYRAACGTSNSEEDNDCRRVREACLQTRDLRVDGIKCPSITRRQPCDWDSNPSLLGHPIYALPFGSRNVNLPVRCRVFCEQKAGGILRGAIIHCALHAHPLLRCACRRRVHQACSVQQRSRIKGAQPVLANARPEGCAQIRPPLRDKRVRKASTVLRAAPWLWRVQRAHTAVYTT